MQKIICFLFLGLGLACTNLEEEPFSEATPEKFFTTEKSLEAALVPAYSSLRAYTWNYWNVSQQSSDETQVTNWHIFYSWALINSHEFLPQDEEIGKLWNYIYESIGSCNKVLAVYEKAKNAPPTKSIYVAEARVLRVFYYFLLLDTFGNGPLLTAASFGLSERPAQATRTQIFDFCEKELREVTPDLLDKAPYGRVNKQMANTLLAKIYLNAEVFTGKPRWNDCLEACDAVIKSGLYELTTDYFDNFKVQNETSKEIIFPIVFSAFIDLGFPNMNFYMRSLHYRQMPVSPWNGFCTIAEFYDGFDQNDYRRSVLWEGPQYERLTWPKASKTGNILKTSSGQPLSFNRNFTPAIAYETNGIRVIKYEPDVKAPGGQAENDYVIFRYADVLLAKAEALVRLGRNAEALPLVNPLRIRAGVPVLTTLNLNQIYQERGFELFWEGFRRQDQIRFGTFSARFVNKPMQNQLYKVLFPIPAQQLEANPKWKQNVGY